MGKSRMQQVAIMSHHRRRLIIAPESPPATPPPEGQPWSASLASRHGQQLQQSRPRAIVQRSRFSLKNTSKSSLSRPSASRQPSPSSPTQPSSSLSHQGGGQGTPVFKFEEELKSPFSVQGRPGPSQRRHSKRLHGLQRSESLEALHGPNAGDERISESEPGKREVATLTGMMGQQQSGQRVPSPSQRSSLDIPHLSRRRTDVAVSAPIQIPSRSKQREERRRRAVAAAKAAASSRNDEKPKSSGRFERQPQSPQTPSKYGPQYSSSEDSEDQCRKGR